MDAERREGRLVGRAEEERELRKVLASVRDGMSGTLILRGEAGIGKSALLDGVVASALDLDVFRVVGIESEMNLGFAALHQLLRPLRDELATLPEPQANALRAAFGMGDSVATDPFLVGLATLTLLAAAAMRRGLVLVVDDAQWLDDESERVLAFVGRRLYADRIGLFVAVREPTARELAFDGLPVLDVGGLQQDASMELMMTVAEASVDDQVRSRVLADAQGNPLAIVELTRELTQHAAPGAASLPQPLPLSRRLETRFLRQVRGLPPATRRLLLTAAADPTGDAALLWRAGEQLDFDEDAAKEAEAADLVRFGPPITFRHPLIREAIYQGANDAERRRTHAALADATAITEDPDRHAWHRAAATFTPDEDVAAELEAAAARARQQGSYASTALLLTRAAELTPDATRRGLRLLDAAASHLTAAHPGRAQTAFESALPMVHDPFVRAQARQLEAAIQRSLGQSGARLAPAIVVQAATEIREFDPRLARTILFDAFQMAIWFGKWASASVHDVARAAKAMPLPEDEPPTPYDLTIDGLAEFFLSGPVAAAPLLRRALAELRTEPSAREVPARMTFGIFAAFALGDHAALRSLGDEYVQLAREGALLNLGEALHYVGLLEIRAGSLAHADAYFTQRAELEEIRSLYRANTVGQMLVLAWRGDEAATRASASAMAKESSECSLGLNAVHIDAALAILELGLGNYTAATRAASEGWKNEIATNVLIAADAIEAHARSGTPELAAEYVALLDERAAAANMPLELGMLARSRALLSDDQDAEPHYQDAITRLTENGGALHLARAQLVYGEWLRRQKRRRDAREQLRAAHAAFSAAGAGAFAERARVELLATGETARKRVDETRDDLTPQETRIATLAAAGATNPEISTHMFISVSTVDYHLRKVYRKLGISSRRELARTISES